MTERKDDRLWGGRFERAPNEQFDAFQRSFAFDRRLLPYEIAVDRAWAKALEPIGILTATEVKQTLATLDKISERAKTDAAWLESFGATVEDVHHFVEKALVEELGPLGWKLRTGRSRNELVATDFRLFVIDSAGEIRRSLAALLHALLTQAKTLLKIPMAGMTHMQHAQPILLSHFLMAHAEAFARGFSRITSNSLDAVSDRDFALDYLFALSGIATHLSRLAEDFVLFSSQEFSYVIPPDEFSTGSSLMPQKKNPDSWELLRGKTGRITSALFSLFTTLKGLPTSYQRDLQEDKETLFAAQDQMEDMIWVAQGALVATKFRVERLCAAASNPALFATDAADYLVHRGVPFRQAHDLVGKVLREAERQGKPWTQLTLEEVRRISPIFEKDFLGGTSVE